MNMDRWEISEDTMMAMTVDALQLCLEKHSVDIDTIKPISPEDHSIIFYLRGGTIKLSIGECGEIDNRILPVQIHYVFTVFDKEKRVKERHLIFDEDCVIGSLPWETLKEQISNHIEICDLLVRNYVALDVFTL